MWLFLGISAIIFTGFNLICSFKSKNEKWFRFGAISFTALTVCSFYSDGAMRVLNEDWGGLMDIMPIMSKALWVCVGISILLNSVSLFREKGILNASANLFSMVFNHRCGAVAVTGADGAFVQTSFAMTLTSRFSRRSICV